MRVLLFNLAIDADDTVLGFTSRWISYLARRVESIHVITMRAGRIELPDNVHVYSVGKEKGFSEPRRAVEFYRHLRRILRDEQIDACFSLMIPIFTVMGAPVLKLKGIPIVTWYAHRQVTKTLKLAHHLSTRVVTSAKTSYRYRHDKVTVIGQGVDTEQFYPDPRDAVSKPPWMVISVGRISPIKDPATLIRSLSLLRERGLDIRATLLGDPMAGDRPYSDALDRLARELGVEDAVQRVPGTTYEQVAPWYRRSFAHVNLSPTGAPDKAALEAMSCGRPSLVANEGFRPTLGRWTDHLLFRHGDHEDLADKLAGLMQQSPATLSEMGNDLRQSVGERHSLTRWTDRVVQVLREVSGGA